MKAKLVNIIVLSLIQIIEDITNKKAKKREEYAVTEGVQMNQEKCIFASYSGFEDGSFLLGYNTVFEELVIQGMMGEPAENEETKTSVFQELAQMICGKIDEIAQSKKIDIKFITPQTLSPKQLPDIGKKLVLNLGIQVEEGRLDFKIFTN